MFAQWDLNRRAGGDYIYIGYTTTTDPSQAVTDVVITDGKHANGYSKNGVSFQSTGLDLNQHAGGAYSGCSTRTIRKRLRSTARSCAPSASRSARQDPERRGRAGLEEQLDGPEPRAGGAYIYLWHQLQSPGTL